LPLTFPEQILITVLDKALIGGLIAFGGYWFSRSLDKLRAEQALDLEGFKRDQTLRIEKFKNDMQLTNESSRTIRVALSELSKCIAAATHSICWATWPAKNTPDGFDAQYIVKYDAEIHAILKDITGARVVLASLSPSVHGQVSDLVDELIRLDVDMGKAAKRFRGEREAGLEALSELHGKALSIDHRLLKLVTGLRIETPTD
jgi:hypothetical protein